MSAWSVPNASNTARIASLSRVDMSMALMANLGSFDSAFAVAAVSLARPSGIHAFPNTSA